MSEVNKINPSFDTRVNASTDAKSQRDNTVREENKRQNSNSKSKPQSKGQERRDSAVTEMSRTLKQEQLEDLQNYQRNVQETYRQRNQQASKEYMQRMKEATEAHTEEIVEERQDSEDVHETYNKRVKDISRNHIQRMLKSKLDDSTFKALEKVADPNAVDEDDTKQTTQKKNTGSRLDKSRLRPEVSKLIAQQKAAPEQAVPQDSKPATPAQGKEPNYDLIENALSKLKGRLGGAYQNNKQQAQQAQNLLTNDLVYAQKQPVGHADAPIRANIGEIQQDIQRAKQLKSSADGTRYVPLDNKDIEKLLTKHKIPHNHAMVQTIKQSSQKLQDSSYYFMRGASILAHAGLEVTPERAELVSESLRMFEKYERPSIMNKLFRYLVNSKYLQLYQTLDKPGIAQRDQGVDLGRALFDPESGQRLDSRSTRTSFAPRTEAAGVQNGPRGLQLPAAATQEALRSAIKAQLQDLGMPANRVMVRQIAQSATGDVMRAQALILQLASGGSLAASQVEPLYQRMMQLSTDQQQQGPLELMKTLQLPIPEKLKQQTSPEAQKLAPFLLKIGLPTTRLDAYPQAREALVELQKLGLNTQSLETLQTQLAKSLQARPEFFLKQLTLYSKRLQTLSQQINTQRFATPEQQQSLSRSIVLALEMPEARIRSWERVRQSLGELSTTPLAVTDLSAKPTKTTTLPAPEAIMQNYGPPNFSELSSVSQQTRAREALLLLHTQGQKNGSLKQLIPLLKSFLSSGAPALETLSNLLPRLQSQVANGLSARGLRDFVRQAFTQPETSASNQKMRDAFPAFNKLSSGARETLTLLYTQAEQLQQLNTFIPKTNQLLTTQPNISQTLTHLLPFVQQKLLNQPLNAEQLQQFLTQLSPTNLSQAAPVTEQAPALFSLTTANVQGSPFEQVLSRFYPQLAPEIKQGIIQQLQQASPQSVNGFFQLHQLLSQMDPTKVQSLAALWQQPQILSRLEKLPGILNPILLKGQNSMTQGYLMTQAQQNQLVQSLQSYLQQGKTSLLKAPLQNLLTPANSDPMSRVKEQLQSLGLQSQQLTPSLLNQVWQLAQGSRQRIDAMGILLQGNLPLLEANIAKVVNTLNTTPGSARGQNAADILLHLAGKLTEGLPMNLGQARVQNPLTQLRTLLQSNLPLMAQHFNPAQTANMPAQQVGLAHNTSPNQLLSLLQQVVSQASTENTGQTHLQQFTQGLQTFLQQLNGLIPTGGQALVTSPMALKNVQEALLALLQTVGVFPEGKSSGSEQALTLQQPVHTLMQTLKSLPQVQSATLAQIQSQLVGLFHELGMLLPALNKRISQSSPLAPMIQTPESALALLSEGNMNAESVQKYLMQWGLQAQSPQQLQQIMQLMQGQQERLDAMAILLKGNMPLLPAHIQVVAQYVKKLPPQERFKSISKVLSFLSDSLITQMKEELSKHQKHTQQTSFPDLPESEAEKATQYLRRQQHPLNEQSYTAARYSTQLLETQNPKVSLPNLLQNSHAPALWLLPIERILGQLQSLFPRYEAPIELEQLRETLSEMKQSLEPAYGKSAELSTWMQNLGAKTKALDKKLQQLVKSLSQQRQVNYTPENWLESLLASLLGLTEERIEKEPSKAAQLQKLQQSIREQLKAFSESLHSLEAFQSAEQNTEQSTQNPLQPLQYIPAYLQELGLSVEILIQPEEESASSEDKAYSEVLLNIKTHTLGDVQLYLQFDTKKQRLQAKMGLNSGKLLRQIQPLLGSFERRMTTLPFGVSPLTTYIVSPEQQGQTVISRRLYKRYQQSAIEKI